MSIAIVFPGQGAQKVGMAKDFYDNSEVSKKIFDVADENLDLNIKEICFEENEDINITEYTQAAMLTACVAMYEEVKRQGLTADVYAGLSLGEYAALVASDVISFSDAVKAVRKRGILMQKAVPVGVGAMAAVLGLENKTVEDVCAEIDGVVVANYNCPGQVVISGIEESIKKAGEKLCDAGAKRVIYLNVSGPFHSFMLEEAGNELESYLENFEMKNPAVPYVTNVTAGYITDNSQIRSLLGKQVYSSVKWQQSVENMIDAGVDTFIEIGPGKTLTGFIKKINKDVKSYNIQKFEDVEAVVKAVKGEQ